VPDHFGTGQCRAEYGGCFHEAVLRGDGRIEDDITRARPMSGPHDWPFERSAKGSVRPWFASAMGYVAVMFGDIPEADRARRGLREQGVPDEDVRLYTSDETLAILDRLDQERSPIAKAVATLTVDRAAKQRLLDNAKAGGAVVWLYAPTEEHADRLLRLLADYNYVSARYFGDDGDEVIRRRDA
jgi:hypothetical protein